MTNKITISKSTRKILHKDKKMLGMCGENLQEVLLFALDEKVEGIGKVEVELPDGQKGIIDATSTEDGFEIPVKSSLLVQTGFVKFQLRILHDEAEIFKSKIVELEVKDSINATETISEQYPSWIDVLENLKQDISTLKEDNEKNKSSISNNTKSIEELQAENEVLKEENKLIKEQIPSR